MTSYYVADADHGGSDSNDGLSSITPKLTLSAVQALVSADGDIVYMTGEFWGETWVQDDWDVGLVALDGCILNGGSVFCSPTTTSSKIVEFSIEGITFRNWTGNVLDDGTAGFIDYRLTRCRFEHNTGTCIYHNTYRTNRNYVYECEFYNNNRCFYHNPSSGALHATYCSNSLFAGNTKILEYNQDPNSATSYFRECLIADGIVIDIDGTDANIFDYIATNCDWNIYGDSCTWVTGTGTKTSLADWVTAATPRDANSVEVANIKMNDAANGAIFPTPSAGYHRSSDQLNESTIGTGPARLPIGTRSVAACISNNVNDVTWDAATLVNCAEDGNGHYVPSAGGTWSVEFGPIDLGGALGVLGVHVHTSGETSAEKVTSIEIKFGDTSAECTAASYTTVENRCWLESWLSDGDRRKRFVSLKVTGTNSAQLVKLESVELEMEGNYYPNNTFPLVSVAGGGGVIGGGMTGGFDE